MARHDVYCRCNICPQGLLELCSFDAGIHFIRNASEVYKHWADWRLPYPRRADQLPHRLRLVFAGKPPRPSQFDTDGDNHQLRLKRAARSADAQLLVLRDDCVRVDVLVVGRLRRRPGLSVGWRQPASSVVRRQRAVELVTDADGDHPPQHKSDACVLPGVGRRLRHHHRRDNKQQCRAIELLLWTRIDIAVGKPLA